MLRNLEMLQLKGNKIVSIPDGLFHLCDRIRFIDYESNKLTSLKWLTSLPPTVTDIFLTKNRISGSIQSEWFTNLKNLQRLELDENKIDSFDFASLSYLPALAVLSLANNQMTSMRDPYLWCTGTSCHSLDITACDGCFCWDKHFNGMTLARDDCFGKSWSAVTVEDLQCESE